MDSTSPFRAGFYTCGVGPEGFQRIRGGLRQRNVELLDRAERFAYLIAKLRCGLAQCRKDLLLSRSGHLLACQHVPARTVQGLQANHVLRSQRRNRACQIRLAPCTLAHFPRQVLRQSSPGERVICRSVWRILSSERMFRKGDCPRSTARACLSVSSNTESPVVLAKSASTMVSFSVKGAA